MKLAHILLGLALLTASTVHAEGKYAVVDMQAVILNVEEGKSARGALETEIKAKQKELAKRKEELDKMNEEWTKAAPLLNEQARMTKQKEFQEKFMGLRNDEMTFQDEIKKKEGQATQKIAMTVTKLVNDIAKANNYEMVFETSSAGLIYLKDPIDLTKDVITAFEAQSKKGATAKADTKPKDAKK